MLQREGTNPGSLLQTYGGVGRNIAECMSRLDSPPFFISSVGKDVNGQTLSSHLTQLGIVSTPPCIMYFIVNSLSLCILIPLFNQWLNLIPLVNNFISLSHTISCVPIPVNKFTIIFMMNSNPMHVLCVCSTCIPYVTRALLCHNYCQPG